MLKPTAPWFIVFALLGVMLGGFAAPAQAANSAIYSGTLSPDDPYHEYVVVMNAGDTIEIDLACAPGSPLDPYVEVYDSNGTLLAADDDSGSDCENWWGSYLEFTAPADGEYIIRATTFGYATYGLMICGCPPEECPSELDFDVLQEDDCSGDYILTIEGDFVLPEGEEPALQTCRLVDLPAGSVVGTFLTDTAAHWAPGKQTAPSVVFAAGKTAWVIGQDESGAYYKIAYLCNYLWVPVESMGPNYDAVWNGTPLPTRVVN